MRLPFSLFSPLKYILQVQRKIPSLRRTHKERGKQMKKSAKRGLVVLLMMVMLIASTMPVSACRNNFVFSKYGVVSSTTREDMVIGCWQAKTKSGISNLEVKANRTFTMTTGRNKKSGRWTLDRLLILSRGKENVSFCYDNKTLESVRYLCELPGRDGRHPHGKSALSYSYS